MRALIIVDVQNDFCPGGTLAVKDGDKIVPVINELQKKFLLVVAAQDWHPKKHKSFASAHEKNIGEKIELNGLEQILWPDHCVQNTKGADFVSNLERKKISQIFRKGTDENIDSYGAFFDNGHKKSTGLEDYLKEMNIDEVFIAGLTTEYCVKYTAIDAVDLGFKTYVIIDACRGVELKTGDVEKAINEMKVHGAKMIESAEVLKSEVS